MRAALVTHSSSLDHVAPWDHPERPERIAAAVEGARASNVEIIEVEARAATRSELAVSYLSKDELSVEEISHLLAYREPNSFYRAFQSWTGMTPLEARGVAVQ